MIRTHAVSTNYEAIYLDTPLQSSTLKAKYKAQNQKPKSPSLTRPSTSGRGSRSSSTHGTECGLIGQGPLGEGIGCAGRGHRRGGVVVLLELGRLVRGEDLAVLVCLNEGVWIRLGVGVGGGCKIAHTGTKASESRRAMDACFLPRSRAARSPPAPRPPWVPPSPAAPPPPPPPPRLSSDRPPDQSLARRAPGQSHPHPPLSRSLAPRQTPGRPPHQAPVPPWLGRSARDPPQPRPAAARAGCRLFVVVVRMRRVD